MLKKKSCLNESHGRKSKPEATHLIPKQQLKLRANCVEKLLLRLKYLILLILGEKSIKKYG